MENFNIMSIALFLSISFDISLSCDGNQRSLKVETTHGYVEGMRDGDCDLFLSIPFAKPPVGKLRWQDPQPAEDWSPNVLKADAQPPGCIQLCDDPSFGCPPTTSEDCLFLNIYRPTNPHIDGLLPVMVFLPGGNFHAGACSSRIYNAQFLAPSIDAIVVCINYRLGAMGFLYLGTDSSTGEDITGNFGLADQAEGLRFVRDNVERFGGDPNRVTLTGQSAGAESITIHLMNAESSDIFQKVIMFSNPFALSFRNETNAALFGSHFASLLNCSADHFACLRNRTADEVAIASRTNEGFSVNFKKVVQRFQPWGPVMDIQMVQIFDLGLNAQKPTMLGSLTEEARIFVYEAFHDPMIDFLYELAVHVVVPGHADEILERYPSDPNSFDQRDVMSRIGTDYIFSCPTQYVASSLCLQGETQVYHYVFDHAISIKTAWERFDWCNGHTCHGGDLPVIFDNVLLINVSYALAETPEEKLMLKGHNIYMRNFIHNGDPNQQIGDVETEEEQELPFWPKFRGTSGKLLSIIFSTDDDMIHVEEDVKLETCQYFDSFGYYGVPYIN